MNYEVKITSLQIQGILNALEDSFGITSNKQLIHRLELVLGSSRVPSRELTYPTVGKGKSSSTMPCEKDTEC